MYAPATGYYSFIYGTTASRTHENSVLSGDSPKLFTTKLADLLTGRNPRGGSVELTLNAAAQEAAYKAMRNPNGSYKRGAVVALDPTTGAILAMVSTPSYDPNQLASHNSQTITRAWDCYSALNTEPAAHGRERRGVPARATRRASTRRSRCARRSCKGLPARPDAVPTRPTPTWTARC